METDTIVDNNIIEIENKEGKSEHDKVYCIKCNTFTENVDPKVVQRQSFQLKALCIKCNSKKNKFLKNKNQIKEEEENIPQENTILNI